MPRKQANGLTCGAPNRETDVVPGTVRANPKGSATSQVSHIAAMSARSPVHVPALEQLDKLRSHMERLKRDMAKAALADNLDKVARLAGMLENAKGQFLLLTKRIEVEGHLQPIQSFIVEGKETSGNPGWAYAPQAKRGFTRAKQQLGRAKTRRTYG